MRKFLKKYLLVGILAILVIGCNNDNDSENVDKPEENVTQSNDSNKEQQQPNGQAQQQNQTLDTTNPTKTALQPQTDQNGNTDQQPNGQQQASNPQAKNSPTLKRIDSVLGHHFSLDDRVVTFQRQGTQYKVVYTIEGENGTNLETKNLSFNQKNDSLSDGTYTYKLKNNKLGLYANGGKQLVFVLQ